MAPLPNKLPHLSPDDVTLDAPIAVALLAAGRHEAGSSAEPRTHCPKVQLVEGSTGGLTSQTECLLRVRLRAAALVLFLGSSAFLIERLLVPSTHFSHEPLLRSGAQLLFWFQAFHVTMLGLTNLVLWRRCRQLSIRQLRLAELAIFGWTGLFFLRVQHFNTLYCVTELGYIPSSVGMWYVLLFTYAIFIPNTWRRAAVVLGILASAPVIWTVIDMIGFPAVAAAAHAYEHLRTLTLMMALGFGCGVYGTHMIGTLRREAFEARQ
jgi:serine/threonine-protein kinase